MIIRMIHQSSTKLNTVVTCFFKSFSFVSLYFYTDENNLYIITVHHRFNGGSRTHATSKMEWSESVVNV